MRVTVRVRPGASRTRVGGSWGPQSALLVSVTARAVDGAANRAVVAALAEAFGTRPRSVAVVQGERSRTKVVEIDIDRTLGEAVHARLLRS